MNKSQLFKSIRRSITAKNRTKEYNYRAAQKLKEIKICEIMAVEEKEAQEAMLPNFFVMGVLLGFVMLSIQFSIVIH